MHRIVLLTWPVFAVVGLITLMTSLDWLLVLVAVLVIVGVAKLPRAAEWTLAFVGALVTGVLALIGFNRVLDELDAEVGIQVGLVLALLFCGGGALAFLRLPPFRRSVKVGLAMAAAVSVVFVLALPPIVAAIREASSENAETLADPIETKLDVMIVLPRPQQAQRVAYTPPDYPGFDVQYSLGFLRPQSTTIDWRLVDGTDPAEVQQVASGGGVAIRERPELRPDADHVLLAAVDGTPAVFPDAEQLPPPGKDTADEVRRWRAAVRRSDPRLDVVPYALLHGSPEDERPRWKGWIRRGAPVYASALGGNSLADAGVRLAAGSATAFEERELAERHRPILLFDTKEPAPRPLLISELFGEGHVGFCESPGDDDCPVQTDPTRLVNGGTHLRLKLPPARELKALALEEQPQPLPSQAAPPASADVPSGTPPAPEQPVTEKLDYTAMYVHTTTVNRGRRRRIYLDYWWYIPYNPADESDDGFCGPGLVTPGLTCFNHESDWEGLTVVLDRGRGADPQPVAVHYAQHNHVVHYDWKALRAYWDTEERYAKIRGFYPDVAERPLAFSARGSHSTYPRSCLSEDNCRQVAENAKEYRHDGELHWAGNRDEDCDLLCLEPLPVRAGGTLPASWNAFKGEWGEPDCWLGIYCESGVAPKAPGAQGRYDDPTRDDGTANPDGTGYKSR